MPWMSVFLVQQSNSPTKQVAKIHNTQIIKYIDKNSMKEVKTRLLDLLDGAQKACFQQKAPVSNKKRRISYSVQHRPTK